MKPSRRKFLAVTGSAAVTSVAGVGSASAAIPISNVPVPDNVSQMYPTMGTDAENPTATVFGNFKCPFTQDFVNNVLPDLAEKYVKPGKMNLRFRTISFDPYGRGTTHSTSEGFISSSDPTISATALGIWEEDPEAYWKYFETMFADPLISGTVTPEKLESVMSQSGVDNVENIVAQVNNGKYDSLVKDSHEESVDLKIQHTPTFEIADSTFVGPKPDDLNDLLSFVQANLSGAETYLPKEDKKEDMKSGGGSSEGSASGETTITFDGSSAQGWANYEFTVSGEFKQTRTMKSSLEDGDSLDGSTASGGVGPWEDTYTYTGELTDLTLSQPIDVLRNDEPLDLEKFGANIESEKLDVKSASDTSETSKSNAKNALSGACAR